MHGKRNFQGVREILRAISRENVEIVRAQYASFQTLVGGGDVRSHFLRFFASDAEYWPVEEIDAICGQDALIQEFEVPLRRA